MKLKMNTETMIFVTMLAVSVLSFFPVELSATTDFGGAEISAKATSIKDFIFGPTMRFAGVLGAGYGVLQAIVSSNIKPFLVYAAIGIGVNVVPKFIDNVFPVATLLLP